MTARIGDEIMITPQELTEPVREGHIREVRNDPGGVVYLVQWTDTGHESLLPHGPDVVIKNRHTRGNEAVTRGETRWLSRLRHPLARGHNRDLERRQQVGYEPLAGRVEEIIAGLGLTQSDVSIAAGRVFHTPQVVSVDPGPPVGLDIRILPGQSPDDFSAHAAAIAYDLGMAEVRVVPLGPSVIRLELLPHDRLPGRRAGDDQSAVP
ncbi:MAG: DUF1918 domain-containing protein [Pseudonocardiaceae bacterium]